MKIKSHSLSDITIGLLKRRRNASGYIDKLVRIKWALTMESIEYASGFMSGSEILAICEAVSPFMPSSTAPRCFIGYMIGASQVIDKYDISTDRWTDILEIISNSDILAMSLYHIVEDYSCGSEFICGLLG